MANQRVGKKVQEVWAVSNPKDSSQLEDIWFNAGEFVQSQFRDEGKLDFFTDKNEAKSDAMKRLEDRNKGQRKRK